MLSNFSQVCTVIDMVTLGISFFSFTSKDCECVIAAETDLLKEKYKHKEIVNPDLNLLFT